MSALKSPSSSTTASSPIQPNTNTTTPNISTTPSSSAIEALHTPQSQLYTHIHPILVLSIFAASFPSTVANPVSSLATLALPMTVLQCAYCVICLPVATAPREEGAKTSKESKGKSAAAAGLGAFRRRLGAAGSGVKGERGAGTWSSRVVTSLLSTILTITLSTPLLALLLLHGAPLISHHPHTFLLALHLSLLSTLPLFYTHGVSGPKWRDLVSLSAPVDETTGAAMGVLVGAWFGAVPIPLDWDREWQRWPVTVVVGAYAGWVVGRYAGMVWKGRKIHWGL